MVPIVIHIRIGTFFLRFFFRIYENLWLIFESSLLNNIQDVFKVLC